MMQQLGHAVIRRSTSSFGQRCLRITFQPGLRPWRAFAASSRNRKDDDNDRSFVRWYEQYGPNKSDIRRIRNGDDELDIQANALRAQIQQLEEELKEMERGISTSLLTPEEIIKVKKARAEAGRDEGTESVSGGNLHSSNDLEVKFQLPRNQTVYLWKLINW